ncbi:hypothetical protein POM88_010882 [Heracleum sosnowskyi]|uniref:Uncharacterized protein n=1 Tax=Heracleum sosnowskyi TaxID=360622 RepID=A0AAD8IW09_9APIA|nr:hypothetical protein POM88_010882 [Heracleum sosnowskyi]
MSTISTKSSFLSLILLQWLLLASFADNLGLNLLGDVTPPVASTVAAAEDLSFDGIAFRGAYLIDSNSFDIRELIVPVVPTLMDPPPPLIASSVWTMSTRAPQSCQIFSSTGIFYDHSRLYESMQFNPVTIEIHIYKT